MKTSMMAMVAGLCLSSAAWAQTGYSITGGLSNFDVHNRCDDPCDEFEIEIEGIRPEDVIHTYRNGNYGSPTVTLSATGLSTIIDYRNPMHLTAVGSVEHFGVSLRQLSAMQPISVRWMRGGAPATVHGVIPTPTGSAPATQPRIPTISAEMGTGSLGADSVVCTVTNTDPAQSIWIKRRAVVTTGNVTLEALMPNDPTVTSSLQIDGAPVLLGPGESLPYNNDLLEAEDNQSVVFAAEYFQNITLGGPFGQSNQVGPELGNVMTASLSAPGTGCEASAPTILLQPVSKTVALNHPVQLQVNADGNDFPLSYQWFKDGQPLAAGPNYSGTTTDELDINAVNSATEGFYYLRVSSTCGVVFTDSALVFVEGHNAPPIHITPPPPVVCLADVAGGTDVNLLSGGPDGVVDGTDFVAFINSFAIGDVTIDPTADVAGGGADGLSPDGIIDGTDFVAFVNAFALGC